MKSKGYLITASIFLLICLSFFGQNLFGQEKKDSILLTTPYLKIAPKTYENFKYPFNKSRVIKIAALNAAAYSIVLIGLNSTWYKNYPRSKFHTFNDFAEWKQMDKFGHLFSAYAEGKISNELWRWTGIERKKRILLSGCSGVAYQTIIELLDAHSSQWGWSWGDVGSNALGSGIFIAQELAWDEQKIQVKWSFHRNNYPDPELENRSDKIFGSSDPERYLKDYNGQTYWLSVDLKTLFPSSNIPRWLQISAGTGVTGIFGARENKAYDENGNITFNRTDIQRERQWYLSPDIDLTKIRTRKKGIRMLLNVLNVFKFPMPALELSGGKTSFKWFYF